MNDDTRPEINELLGAYALDAVDPDERDLVERHLADDPAARAEVDEMRETAAVLASLPVDDEGAPPGLWNRIVGAIAPPEAVRPITTAKRRNSIPMRVFVPFAAAAALIIAVLAVQVATRSPNRAGNLAAAYDNAVANGATTVSLARSGSTKVVAKIALNDDGSGFLRSTGLELLPDGKTYQLWAIARGRGQEQPPAISAGVLGDDPRAVAFHVDGRPDAFALTIEDDPGVVSPTRDPAAVGTVPT